MYLAQAVLVNEFRGLRLDCSDQHIVPRGPGYNDSRYQTCAMQGSQPGSLVVKGEDYLEASFDFSYDHLWRNFFVIIVLALIFLVIGVIATDVFHFAPSGSVRLFARSKNAKERLRREKLKLAAKDRDPEVVVVDTDTDSCASSVLDPFDGQGNKSIVGGRAAVLTWKDVSLWIRTPETKRIQLLDGISGYICPGEMTALMGMSGAGKTTRGGFTLLFLRGYKVVSDFSLGSFDI
jgi:ATP-binding cassette subfamily G (WHITE) protein 2 (SNQ2)